MAGDDPGRMIGTVARKRALDRYAGFGSLGSPKTRSLTMLRWIWLVPPQIVSEREKKNDEIIGDTGYSGRRLARSAPGHDPDSGPASTSSDSAP